MHWQAFYTAVALEARYQLDAAALDRGTWFARWVTAAEDHEDVRNYYGWRDQR